jgi:hypothetical protein
MFSNLPNSFGVLSLPWRMICVVGSSTVTTLPGESVTHRHPSCGLSQHLVDERNHRVQLLLYPAVPLAASDSPLASPRTAAAGLHLLTQLHQRPVLLPDVLLLLPALGPAEPGISIIRHPVVRRPIPQSRPSSSTSG